MRYVVNTEKSVEQASTDLVDAVTRKSMSEPLSPTDPTRAASVGAFSGHGVGELAQGAVL